MLKEINIKSFSNWIIFIIVCIFCLAGVGIIIVQIIDLSNQTILDHIAFWLWMGLTGGIFLMVIVIIILKKLGKIPSFVVGGVFQLSILIFSGLSQFGALLMGMEIQFDKDIGEKDITFITFTIVLFVLSFVLSLIGYYISQIIQNKTNLIIKRTVDVVEKRKKHTPRDSKKMIKDVTDITGIK